MAKTAEYQDSDVMVVSHNPLQGRLMLVTEDDDEIDLVLDKNIAEALVCTLVQFLIDGDMSKISIGR